MPGAGWASRMWALAPLVSVADGVSDGQADDPLQDRHERCPHDDESDLVRREHGRQPMPCWQAGHCGALSAGNPPSGNHPSTGILDAAVGWTVHTYHRHQDPAGGARRAAPSPSAQSCGRALGIH